MPRCQVFSLRGSEKLECKRKYIECLGDNPSLVASVCINGIIYYIGGYSRRVSLMRFHIRSELFYHIQTPETLQQMDLELTLVNYQGKLGCICYNSNDSCVEMWIMEDDDDDHYWMQLWSKIKLFISPSDILLSSLLYESRTFIISGVTRDGEIVIMPKTWSYAETLYAYFHDPMRNETRRVGFETNMKGQLKYRLGVCIFCEPDHFENTVPLFENESATTRSPKNILSARKKASKCYGIVESSMRLY